MSLYVTALIASSNLYLMQRSDLEFRMAADAEK
jgi:hypothetical protein